MLKKYRKILKNILPKNLFGRFLLIIILPIFIVQAISIYVFYERHIQNVVKKISNTTIEKIKFINDNFEQNKNFDSVDFDIYFMKNIKIRQKDLLTSKNIYTPFNQQQYFVYNLLASIKEPISIREKNDDFVISIQKNDGVLVLQVNKKNFIVKTAQVFVLWSAGSSLIMLAIAIIFMRNQLKPIQKLKKNMRDFSINKNVVYMKPAGAKEIRELTASFMEMQKRIKRFIEQRTLMLAAISHDLRTPLTRMKLTLEFLDSDEKENLSNDIKFMEDIIDQYLVFTKDIKNEEFSGINILEYIQKVINDYRKINDNIEFVNINLKKESIFIQPLSFKRIINNLLDNCFKFASEAKITTKRIKNKIIINIEDNGNSVDEELLSKLYEPFFRADQSRNSTNGVGLGLAIVKDLVLLNGGNLVFKKSKSMGGLEVEVVFELKPGHI